MNRPVPCVCWWGAADNSNKMIPVKFHYKSTFEAQYSYATHPKLFWQAVLETWFQQLLWQKSKLIAFLVPADCYISLPPKKIRGALVWMPFSQVMSSWICAKLHVSLPVPSLTCSVKYTSAQPWSASPFPQNCSMCCRAGQWTVDSALSLLTNSSWATKETFFLPERYFNLAECCSVGVHLLQALGGW